MNQLPILFAGNIKVFDGMVISLLSIVRHHKEPITVYLMTMDLSDVNPAFVPLNETHRCYLETICTEVCPDSRVILLDVGPMYREVLLNAPNKDTSYTPYCFLRLFADRFPQLPDKLIYLDTDTVLAGDLSELYRVDVENCEFAAVRDYYGCHFFGINYCNSGVLLLNLRKIRETGLFRKALSACAAKKIFLPDQTAINRFCVAKKLLPSRFNEQKHLKPDTLIRHFSMTILWFPWFHTRNIKPWQPELVHKDLKITQFDDILDDYIARKPGFPAMEKGELIT